MLWDCLALYTLVNWVKILSLAVHLLNTYIIALKSEVPIVSQQVCDKTGGRNPLNK